MSLTAGTRLGPYEVLGLIGAGGMGEVYRARDTRLDRTVAIKILAPQFSADQDRRARFEREAKTIAGLTHPNICTLHDVGSTPSTGSAGSPQAGSAGSPQAASGQATLYLVMELLTGETLAERLRKGPLPLEQALVVATEIADALAAAHRHGVIHRDLKPGNVMLTKTGAKLLDFGLAKLAGHAEQPAAAHLMSALTRSTPLTGEGVILGTVQYMAPEQLEGKPADARTDLWAFGAMLYEMLTGKRAFEGTSAASLIGAILEREPTPLSTLVPLTPPSVDRLVRQCLAKSPDDRPDTAHDLATQLRWMRDGSGSGAATAVQPRRRRPLRTALLPAIALVAAIAGAGAMWLLRPSEPPPVARVVRFTIELPISRRLGSMSLSPDGKKLVYVGTEASQSRIYMRSFDTGFDEPLIGTDGGRAPFFSPDGSQVGFFVRNDVMSVPVGGGTPTTIWRLPAVQFANRGNAAAWLDDGTIVCSAGAAGLWRVSVSGEQARLVAGVDPARGERSFGRAIFMVGRPYVVLPVTRGATLDPAPIDLVSLDTGTRRPLVPDGIAPHYLATGHVVYWVKGGLVAAAFDRARMELTGSTIPVVDAVRQFSISTNGDLAYALAASELPSTLVRLDRKGVMVSVANLPPGAWSALSLAPDGRRIATHQSEGGVATLWTIDVDRGDLSLFGREGNPHAPVWSADGRSIVFSSYRGGQISNLFLQNADGAGEPKSLVQSPLHSDPGSWSRDGRWLAYAQSSPETGYDVWTLDTQSRRPAAFRQTTSDESMPRISPDGAWLAYQSNETGRSEIYVEAFPAGGRRAKISLDGGTEPLWCDADRTLLYRSGNRLMSVRVSTQGGSPAPDKPVLQLEGSFVRASTFGPSAYAVSPDGRHFYFVQQAASPPSPATIHVVLGWIEEFKRRLK